jgi:hypothetical protein
VSASSRLISERAVGQYPISIATSLALESLTGVHPEIYSETPPVKDYDELWINLKTLFRNLLGAMEGDGAKLVLGAAVSDELQQEMTRVEEIVAEFNPSCKVWFYVSNYKDLERKYPKARVRRDTTENQKHYTRVMHDALQKLLLAESPDRTLVFDLKLKPKTQRKVLILTHYAFDLCSAEHFGSMTLIESHTGVLKDKAQWYSKYLNGKQLTTIPFREDMLQIFGDNELFHPFPIRERQEILEVAKQYKWTVLSTTDRIRFSIEALRNKYFLAILKSMLV